MLLYSGSVDGVLGDTQTNVGAQGYANMQTSVNAGYAGNITRLGTRALTRDGRVFRFCRAGGTTLIVGNVIQASAPVANHLAMTPSAAAVGATAITLTLGATLATVNQYAEGYLQVDTTPGNGYMYAVNSHLAIAQSAAGVINLEKDDAIVVALTTASRLGLLANPYADVIISATTVTAPVMGVAIAPITNGNYGWLQTWGPCAALINGTPGVGIGVVSGATTAGSFDVAAVAAEINVRILGRMMQVGVSTKNNGVYLSIAP